MADFHAADLWVAIVPETSKVGPAMEEAGKEAKKKFREQVKDFGKTINDDLDKVGTKSKDVFTKMGTGARDTFTKVGQHAKDVFARAGRDSGDEFNEGLNDSVKRGKGLREQIGETIGAEIGTAIGERLRDIPIVATVADTLKNVGSGLKGFSDALAGLKSGDTSTALSGVQTAIGNVDEIAKRAGFDISGWTGQLAPPVNKAKEMADKVGDVKSGVKGLAETIAIVSPGMAESLTAALGPIGVAAAGLITIGEMLKARKQELADWSNKWDQYAQHPENWKPLPPQQQQVLGPQPALPATGPVPSAPKAGMLDIMTLALLAGGPPGVTEEEKNNARSTLQNRAARGDKEAQNALKDLHLGWADGGPITGPGQIGKDSVLMLGAPGEHMITADEVDGAGGHNAVYAIRSMMKGGFFKNIRGFAGGGALNTQGAQVDTIAIAQAVQQQFGLSDIGMYRSPDGYNEHSSGEAADVMIPGSNKALGDSVKNFALANAAAFGVKYCLWQQRQWNPDGSSSGMADRGSPTQNHMDHVHIRTAGGGYPQGGGPGSAGAGSMPAGTSATPAPAVLMGGMPGVGGRGVGSFGAASWGGGSGGGGYGPGGPGAYSDPSLQGDGNPMGTENNPVYVTTGQGQGGAGGGPFGSQGEQLAQGMGRGFLELFGLDGSVFGGKSPLDFGAVKLFSRVANTFGRMFMGQGGGAGMGIPGLPSMGGSGIPNLAGLLPSPGPMISAAAQPGTGSISIGAATGMGPQHVTYDNSIKVADNNFGKTADLTQQLQWDRNARVPGSSGRTQALLPMVGGNG